MAGTIEVCRFRDFGSLPQKLREDIKWILASKEPERFVNILFSSGPNGQKTAAVIVPKAELDRLYEESRMLRELKEMIQQILSLTAKSQP